MEGSRIPRVNHPGGSESEVSRETLGRYRGDHLWAPRVPRVSRPDTSGPDLGSSGTPEDPGLSWNVGRGDRPGSQGTLGSLSGNLGSGLKGPTQGNLDPKLAGFGSRLPRTRVPDGKSGSETSWLRTQI